MAISSSRHIAGLPFQEEALFLKGPQGCGKGTQGKKLAIWFEQWGLKSRYLESRDLLKTTGCPQIRDLMDHGREVPDSLVKQLFGEAIAAARRDGCERIIIDGYPRYTAGQADDAAALLEEHGITSAAVLRFRASREFCEARILSRYHEALEAFERGQGDEPRKDDGDPEVIARRLNRYNATWAFVYRQLTLRHRFRGVVLTLRDPDEEIDSTFGRLLNAMRGVVSSDAKEEEVTGYVPEGAPRIRSPFDRRQSAVTV